ncbi:hypothetical protein R3P38DRAFT_3184017 [Favolaschia claudopus]|uniref:Uncharacterized protein n=1 Tax=Favolaschia claudopus TaxID=2862362 RepID=A0AAW0CBX7_9AGAR
MSAPGLPPLDLRYDAIIDLLHARRCRSVALIRRSLVPGAQKHLFIVFNPRSFSFTLDLLGWMGAVWDADAVEDDVSLPLSLTVSSASGSPIPVESRRPNKQVFPSTPARLAPQSLATVPPAPIRLSISSRLHDARRDGQNGRMGAGRITAARCREAGETKYASLRGMSGRCTYTNAGRMRASSCGCASTSTSFFPSLRRSYLLGFRRLVTMTDIPPRCKAPGVPSPSTCNTSTAATPLNRTRRWFSPSSRLDQWPRCL